MKKTKGQVAKSKNNNQKTLENEIIIGLTPKKNNKTIKKEVKKKQKIKKKEKKVNNEKKSKKAIKERNNKKGRKVIKYAIIVIILLTITILFMLSDAFNIKQIIVISNNKISTEEILELSSLEINNNMFKTSNKRIKNNIKTNPYIEDVKIKRSLDGIITLEIQERIATYMLQYGNSYIYINNQGYILEISETPLNLPIIIGYQTNEEMLTAGNRLVKEDLSKLQDIIKIIDLCKNTTLENKITEINIQNSNNYILQIESEGKTIQFGDNTDIKVKILKIEAILEQTKEQKGEIYFQNSKRTVFKESV